MPTRDDRKPSEPGPTARQIRDVVFKAVRQVFDRDRRGTNMPDVRLRPRGNLHHVSFRVDNLERSLDFYVVAVGCRQLPRPDFGFPGAWLDAGDVQVHLLQVDDDATYGRPPTVATPLANHIAFQVDDLEAFAAHLSSNGIEATPGHPANPALFVQDPSGNVIEFTPLAR